MNVALFLILLAIFGIASLLIGLRTSKDIKDQTDFFLAGRQLGLGAVTFTLIATQLGGGMMLGIAQKSYEIGYLGVIYAISMSIGFILLAMGFASKLRSFNVATTADLFETKYKSITLKKIASFISAATMCGILLGQVAATKSLLLGLGINNNFVFILFWLMIIAYTMLGGLKAVVVTDIFQVIFIIIMFGGIFAYSLYHEPASLFSLAAIKQNQLLFPEGLNALMMILPTLIMPALFSLIEQDLAQRFFAAKTQRIALGAALLASIFMITFSCIPLYFGLKAYLANLPVIPGANPLVISLRWLTTPFVFALGICGLIAAITSTADSLLCAITSHIAQDFDFSWAGLTNKLTVSKIGTFVIGVIVLASSYAFNDDVIDILVNSYTLAVSCLFVPLMFCFFKKEFNKYAAGGAMASGLLGFIVFSFIPTPVPTGIIPLILSLLGYGIGEYIGWKHSRISA